MCAYEISVLRVLLMGNGGLHTTCRSQLALGKQQITLTTSRGLIGGTVKTIFLKRVTCQEK